MTEARPLMGKQASATVVSVDKAYPSFNGTNCTLDGGCTACCCTQRCPQHAKTTALLLRNRGSELCLTVGDSLSSFPLRTNRFFLTAAVCNPADVTQHWMWWFAVIDRGAILYNPASSRCVQRTSPRDPYKFNLVMGSCVYTSDWPSSTFVWSHLRPGQINSVDMTTGSPICNHCGDTTSIIPQRCDLQEPWCDKSFLQWTWCTTCSIGQYAEGCMDADGGSCTACTQKPSHSEYTAAALEDTCSWACSAGYTQVGDGCVNCGALCPPSLPPSPPLSPPPPLPPSSSHRQRPPSENWCEHNQRCIFIIALPAAACLLALVLGVKCCLRLRRQGFVPSHLTWTELLAPFTKDHGAHLPNIAANEQATRLGLLEKTQLADGTSEKSRSK